MDHAGPSAALPLRPLTVGELLDAAVGVLRDNARTLLPAGLLLAAAEQLALAPVRAWAQAPPPTYVPQWEDLDRFWVLLTVGAATEAVAILLLGGAAARAASAALLGTRLPARRVLDPRATRLGPVVLVALLVGALTLVTAFTGLLWIPVYGLTGLIIPVLVVDRLRVGRAIGRGLSIATRHGARGLWVRLLGATGWLAMRIALALSGVYTVDLLGLTHPGWAAPLGFVVWTLANTLAYPTLACLDAVVYLETRMRTEGLDIRLARARAHGTVTETALAQGTPA
ncbi:hypothetical protein [Catenuloplanes atrovinosus]|uniref:Glycerophosphoryl diester phosphodiesterase membrane domain-containing protein n=1 Tax=Catenuloplanes atrovinosus TaxID=137266 RepID=A0AAE4CC05_9ACTN|nr:hypothetical protein [Catenuloplanes atrovinosus]MDR7279161.1 hypothetical protein [Catenuloplanes atrovinosus]